MAVVNLTAQDFQAAVEKDGILFIDFWATWCGPCRAFAPVFEEISRDNPDLVFAKVDTDKEEELSASFQIRSIPTLMAFRDGVLLFSQAGALPKNALQDLVKRVRALDMAEVRAQIAAGEARGPGSGPNDEAAGESEA